MSTLAEDTELLQGFAGVDRDRVFGAKTAAALVAKLGLRASADVGTRRVCVDAGHGMGNRTPGVYDPGCVNGSVREADIALAWAKDLRTALLARGVPVFLTRADAMSSTPVGSRARMAANAGCNVLVSIHVNDADSATANGCETLFSDDRDFAAHMHRALKLIGLRDRGTKPRSDLAVLKFDGPAVLLELGFIHHAGDLAAMQDQGTRERVCEALADAINVFRV